jgi:pimeloyl-ACP methyl ester carboxylesterase
VVRYDLPGFGLTGPDPTHDYSDGRSVVVLLALMDTLGVKRASLVGNSMGGRIAWTFAALHPARVNKLVLVSPDGFASPGNVYGVASKTPLLMRALPYTLPPGMFRASLTPAFADPNKLSGASYTRYRDMMLAPGVHGAILGNVLAKPWLYLHIAGAATALLIAPITSTHYPMRRLLRSQVLATFRRRKRLRL